MKDAVQVIEKDGAPEWVVVPFALYQELREKAELAEDITAYDEAVSAISAGEELIPAAVADRLLKGENPVRVWRDHRGLTQHALAAAAGISPAFLSQIESGKRSGSTRILKKLAEAIDVDLDDLV